MSAKATQDATVIDRLGIEEGDTIRSGPADAWTVTEVKNSAVVDCNLVVRSHEGEWSNMDPEQVSQCQCGLYTLGDAPCYGCYHNRPENSTVTGTKRIPDAIPRPGPAGHARDEQLDDAILSVGPHELPDGRNY
jgi:hypothetical protein